MHYRARFGGPSFSGFFSLECPAVIALFQAVFLFFHTPLFKGILPGPYNSFDSFPGSLYNSTL
jgi:hypothetical protein